VRKAGRTSATRIQVDRVNERTRILFEPDVCELVGISRPTLLRWQKQGLFPVRRQLGPNRIGWLEREVLDWIQSRPQAQAANEGRR